MIINTGGRTDTVQYYTEWLLNRFSEGYVLSRNPLFPNKVTRYELTPDTVDCVVFCSKNYKPILPRLHEITDRFHTYFHYTITAYGKDIEPGVPGIEESMETLIKLAGLVGKQRIAWRYDPVLLTKEYTVQRHIETWQKCFPLTLTAAFSVLWKCIKNWKVICRSLFPYLSRIKTRWPRDLALLRRKTVFLFRPAEQTGIFPAIISILLAV